MPVFEYECRKCRRVSSFLVRNPAAHKPPACPHCGHPETYRVFSRFAAVKTGRAEPAHDSSPDLDGLDENDPRSLGRVMRKMAEETGEPMPPEMDQMVRRLEAGEDPEKLGTEREGLEGGAGGPAGEDALYDG